MLGLFWGAAAIALPLFIKVGEVLPPRYTKDFFFQFLVMFSLFAFGIKKHKNDDVFLLSGFLLMVGFFNQYNYSSISVFYQFTLLSVGVLLFNQIISNVTSHDIKLIKNGLAVSCIIQSALVCISFTGVDLYKEVIELFFNVKSFEMGSMTSTGYVFKGSGSLGNRNVAGAFIASTLPFLFNKRFKVFIPLGLCGLGLTTSAMPLLSIGFAAVFLFLVRSLGKRSLLPLTGVGLLAAFILFNTSSNNGFFTAGARIKAWGMVFENVAIYDLIKGSGLGFVFDNWKLWTAGLEKFKQLHNEYLELLVAFGALGVGLFINLLIKSRDKILNGDKQFSASLVVFLVNAFGFFNLHLTSTALVGILSLGCLLKESECHDLGTINL